MKTEFPFSQWLPGQALPGLLASIHTAEAAITPILHATSILIADALPLFRRGLLHVLAQTFGGYPLYEAGNRDELLTAASCHQPTLVLLATNLVKAPADMLALLQALRAQHAQATVLVFIDPAAGFEVAGLRLLRHNVSCLLTRAASPVEVCDSIRVVLQQGKYYNDYTLGLLLQAPATTPRSRATGGFSARQLEVLHLIAEDLSNEEIADCLCTSVRTVEYHRSQMLHKTGTRTTLGLVLFAQRQGLLPVPSAGAA